MSAQMKSLLGAREGGGNANLAYGTVPRSTPIDEIETSSREERVPRRNRSWSLHDSTPVIGNPVKLAPRLGVPAPPSNTEDPAHRSYSKHASLPLSEAGSIASVGSRDMQALKKLRAKREVKQQPNGSTARTKGGLVYYIIYAIVNVIISLPGLYGYAAVIFNHPVFQDHMNALSKLVIFSSLIHQLGFLLFSSLPFAIGTVQDAGLIFLSSMSNKIANTILDDGGTEEQVVSTTLVLLSLGTAMLGLVLIVMGKLNLANAVSYLPMPVVGGYLAFIGYFCLQAGTGLCISESMMSVLDWGYLADPELVLLAVPGLLAGMLLTYVSRNVENDAALPVVMCLIPTLFYVGIFGSGIGISGARNGGWVGETAPPVPLSDLFQLVDFKLVRWDLILEILSTWTGMVFVVSFASCLDVAAISMDMGEALETNRELATVGICNLMSGLTFGFTGSYIFSQTIFTFRTGVHSKWIGFFIMCVFMYVVASPVNILQVAPLFFLGSTLIFIGFDLLYEWLIEIRHKIFLSEYAIVWATFIAIQVVGIDAGIVLGVLVAIVEHAVLTAQTSTVKRVSKQSRAVWTPSDYKLLHEHGYHPLSPKIITLEITGTVFFGSSLQLLERLSQEIGLDLDEEDSQREKEELVRSPHQSARLLMDGVRRNSSIFRSKNGNERAPPIIRLPPKFIVLDLTQVPNLDASASRGCFLQLARLCAKRGMVVCASGASPRVKWMLQCHDVAYSLEDEDRIKANLQASRYFAQSPPSMEHQADETCERVLLFLTLHEALEFAENALIRDLSTNKLDRKTPSFIRLDQYGTDSAASSIGHVISHVLGLSGDERQVVEGLQGERFHTEETLNAGTIVYSEDTHAGAFYVVLQGVVAVAHANDDSMNVSHRSNQTIVSGAGLVRTANTSSRLLEDPTVLDMGTLTSFYPVGSIFGFVDFLLERPRRVRMVASQDETIVAKFTRSQMALLRAENGQLDGILQRVLLQAAVVDLANCTCAHVD